MAEYALKIDGNRVIFDGHAENERDCHALTLLCDLLQKHTKTVQYKTGYAAFELEETPSENRFWYTDSAAFTMNGISVSVFAAGVPPVIIGSNSFRISISVDDTGLTVHNNATSSYSARVKVAFSDEDDSISAYFSIRETDLDAPIAPGDSFLFPFADGIKLYALTDGNGAPIQKGDVITDDGTQLSVTQLVPCGDPGGVTLATEGKYCPKNVKVTPKLQTLTVTENGEATPPEGYAGFGKVTVNVESRLKYGFDDLKCSTADGSTANVGDLSYALSDLQYAVTSVTAENQTEG